MVQRYPDDKAYKKVKIDLQKGRELTFAHIGAVFGPEFWYMVVESLMDAQEAARAIQGAINRLSTAQPSDAVVIDDDADVVED